MSPKNALPANEKIALHKDLLRYSIRTQRSKALPRPQRWAESFAESIHTVVASAQKKLGKEELTIAAYLPVAVEPPLIPALTQLSQAGHRILVPVVEPQRQLSWVVWTPEVDFGKNSLGIEEPLGERFGTETFAQADVHLIPALALDSQGYRLGQGGGYYDRFLTAEIAAQEFTYGIVFSSEVLDGLPKESWDSRLHRAITEEGIVSFGN